MMKIINKIVLKNNYNSNKNNKHYVYHIMMKMFKIEKNNFHTVLKINLTMINFQK